MCTETKNNFINKLETLACIRLKTIENILKAQQSLELTEKMLEQLTLTLKLQAQKIINNASVEEIKTKFSNDTKRKLFTEEYVSSNQQFKAMTETAQKNKEELMTLESSNRKEKITERYLMKQIDIHLGEM